MRSVDEKHDRKGSFGKDGVSGKRIEGARRGQLGDGIDILIWISWESGWERKR